MGQDLDTEQKSLIPKQKPKPGISELISVAFFILFHVSPLYVFVWLRDFPVSDFETFPLHIRAITYSAPFT